MKKIILTFIALVACGLVANAATKYEINIAGTEVTSDNCSYIAASNDNDITSGYAVYTPSTNTLTCYNLKIYRTGSGSYGIHNRKCDNLTIVFKGGYSQVATADHAMNLARSTTIIVDEGATADIYTGGSAHALNLGSYTYYIKGSGDLELNGKNAIHGNGTGSTTIYFEGAKVLAQSNLGNSKNHALESFKAVFNEGADLKIEANSNMTSVNNVSMSFSGKETLLEPYGAYYSSNAVYTSSGSQITSDDIYISDNYVALINSSNFPDANFRSALLSFYPKGYITSSDVNSRTSMTISGKSITDISGIGYFSKLTYLDCRGNKLKSLPDLPPMLETLLCASNNFETLHLTNYAHLKTLDISYNTHLTSLFCNNNALTNLNVDFCQVMTTLNCSNNQLTSFGSFPASLETLNCSNNKFNTLAIIGSKSLSWLNVGYNQNLTILECHDNVLKTLKVEGCSSLIMIDCHNNQITSLTVTPPHLLQSMDCSNNKLSGSYHLSGLSTLKTLNISNNPNLTELHCHDNALKNLNVTGCSSIKILDCSYNYLTALSVQGLNSLEKLEIYRNQIKEAAMGTLVNELRTIPAGSLGEFKVQSGSSEGNVITPTQVTIARNKRWIPKKYVNNDWAEITLKGDVNGDGKVNVSDVTALVNMILGTIPKDPARGDINGDGNVNVSDVTALVNIILGQS